MTENLTLTYGDIAKDLATVRAYVQRVILAVIARSYYDYYEDPQTATPALVEPHLRGLLDGLSMS